jgi:hypothetical protein
MLVEMWNMEGWYLIPAETTFFFRIVGVEVARDGCPKEDAAAGTRGVQSGLVVIGCSCQSPRIYIAGPHGARSP